MSFSAIIPASDLDSANVTLEEAGFGPDNFSVPLWRDDEQAVDSYGLNASGLLPEFRLACEGIPNVSIRVAQPGAVEFDEHVTSLGLKREPTPIPEQQGTLT
jgi:hypothetical protein